MGLPGNHPHGMEFMDSTFFRHCATLMAGIMVASSAGPLWGKDLTMTRTQAAALARLALQGIQKEYPNKPADVLNSGKDIRPTRAIHPAFFGSFDWHSCVHSHWMLVRLLRQFPDLPESKQIRAVLRDHLSAQNLKTEA